jgi:hypothetical protein
MMMAVPTWRERASQQAQDDLDGLVNALLPFAQKMLNEQGEFFPFGAAVTSDGETRLWSSDPDGGERPPSAAVQAYLLSGFRSERDHLPTGFSSLQEEALRTGRRVRQHHGQCWSSANLGHHNGLTNRLDLCESFGRTLGKRRLEVPKGQAWCRISLIVLCVREDGTTSCPFPRRATAPVSSGQ